MSRFCFALICTGMLLPGLLFPPAAKADGLTFLQALNNHGIVVYDTARALTWGQAICTALNQTTGDVVAANFYRITNSDIPDMNTALTWVVVSVEQLCPWQDHRRGMAV